jgi:hypothetical protein
VTLIFFMGELLNHVESLAICSDKYAKPVLLMFFVDGGLSFHKWGDLGPPRLLSWLI